MSIYTPYSQFLPDHDSLFVKTVLGSPPFSKCPLSLHREYIIFYSLLLEWPYLTLNPFLTRFDTDHFLTFDPELFISSLPVLC